MKYTLHVNNDLLASIAEQLTARGAILGITGDGAIHYGIEADDLWEAGVLIQELKGELEGLGLTTEFDFSKPVEVGEHGFSVRVPDPPCTGWTPTGGCPLNHDGCEDAGTCLLRSGAGPEA